MKSGAASSTAASYSVSAAELASKSELRERSLHCHIVFLDNTTHKFSLNLKAKGQELLCRAYDYLELLEREYFGLQYLHPKLQEWDWLEAGERILKQFQGATNCQFTFRVRYFVPDPCELKEEYTRYYYFLQLRRDILDSRLPCPQDKAVALASLVLQSELGDFDAQTRADNYVSDFRLVPHQTAAYEAEVAASHAKRKGLLPAAAELEYVKLAQRLEHYGVVLWPAKDIQGTALQLGPSCDGICIFIQDRRTQTHLWTNIEKIQFKNTHFFIRIRPQTWQQQHSSTASHLSKTGDSSQNPAVTFVLNNVHSCHLLYVESVTHHWFFRLVDSVPLGMGGEGGPEEKASGGLFSCVMSPLQSAGRPVTRFYGRTYHALMETRQCSHTLHRQFVRSSTRQRSNFRQTKSYPQILQGKTASSPSKSQISQSAAALHPQDDKRSASLARSHSLRDTHRASMSRASPRAAPSTVSTGGPLHSSSAVALISARSNSTPHASGLIPRNSVATYSAALTQQSKSNKRKAHEAEDEDDGGFRTLPVTTTSSKTSPPATPLSSSVAAVFVQFKNQPNSATGNARSSANSHHSTQSPLNHTSSPRSATLNTSHSSSSRLQHASNDSSASPRHADNDLSTSSTVLRHTHNGSNSSTKFSPAVDNCNSTPSRHYFATEEGGEGLVSIRIRADDLGRFGFNVNGGSDRDAPVVVSRVGANMPADLSFPRLQEGDEVLYIQGRPVDRLTHDQVVQLIRAAAEKYPNELVLQVRQKNYMGADEDTECLDNGETFLVPSLDLSTDTGSSTASTSTGPRSSLTNLAKKKHARAHGTSNMAALESEVPQAPVRPSRGATGNPLLDSMLALEESLRNGLAMRQFEQMYRINPDLKMAAANQTENMCKNRYRDIQPYDDTRVHLQPPSSTGTDYINASFLNMKVASSGIVHHYIATQGPMPNTCADFWQMVWQQHVGVLVMLTATMERGRVKCHQYWPSLHLTSVYGDFQVMCLSETEKYFSSENGVSKRNEQPIYIEREFLLTQSSSSTSNHRRNTGGSEERRVVQLHYENWPDHGPPEDDREFFHFVTRVRQLRADDVAPVLVHCSAGIGRSGVLIAMETALALVEAGEAVIPLRLVQRMRDQRPSMMQTQSQYEFFCHAILNAYHKGLVAPSPNGNRESHLRMSQF